MRTKSMMVALAVAGVTTAALAAGTQAASARKPVLLIVGTSHFDNPGRDIANMKVEDVLVPERQREIAAVVDSLAAWHPTHVAVEWPAKNQAALDKRYADYRAGRYTLTRDERDQLGLRLAAKLNLPRVDAVDWMEESPGTDADYDYVAWAKANGRGADWEAFQAESQRHADALSARQRCTAVADWLRVFATPEMRAQMEEPYYRIASFGEGAVTPGANWVGAWHTRNLRIYDNLRRVAGKPGDRTVAIYGAGHAALLTQYARESGTFTVDPTASALPKATRARC